jgi:hypothetical protein
VSAAKKKKKKKKHNATVCNFVFLHFAGVSHERLQTTFSRPPEKRAKEKSERWLMSWNRMVPLPQSR